MSQPSQWWQRYGTLAQMAQAAVALLGFVAIMFQINEIRTNARATPARVRRFSAIPIWRSRIRSFRIRTSMPSRPAVSTSARSMRASSPYFLYACEETIAAFADKREWQASCDYDLKPHLPFLCEKNVAQPAYLATYGTETQQWVKTSLKTASVTPPDCKLGKS